MADFDYISELKAPSLKCHSDGSLPSPQEIDAYFAYVEQKRQEFLSFLSDKKQNVISAYIDELIRAQKAIDKRGFHSLPSVEVVSAITGGVEGSETLLEIRNIDSRLYSSAESTIAFLKSILGDADTQPTLSDVSVNSDEVADTGWYTIDEVCRKYKLPKNNVKSREWRIRVGFPTHQDGGAYSSVRFNASEVEEWLSKTKQ